MSRESIMGIKVIESTRDGEAKVFRRIADDIDAEKRAIYEAQEDCLGERTSPHHIIKAYAENIGKPMQRGESITDWLNRYYLPRPLFDDGEPAQFGDTFVRDFGRDAKIDSLSYTKGNSDYVNINGYERHDFGHRLKRPKPQVLDADGVPIEVGDTVWVDEPEHVDCPWEVVFIYKDGDVTVHQCFGGEREIVVSPSQITHREPDTQERIDADALRDYFEYWGCTGARCKNCPALVDGKKPRERYGVNWCSEAMRLGLIRRTRELYGRNS